MAEEPEVIQGKMDETRTALAEKLGALAEKVTGTVETVQETVQATVENVGQTVETVEQVVENVAHTVENTVETVGETAQAAVENVKEAFNFPKQFDRHPWLFVGGSVLLGFVGGKVLLNLMPERDHGQPSSAASAHMPDYMERASAYTPAVDYSSRGTKEWDHLSESATSNGHGASQDQGPSWLSGLIQRFMPDLTKVKELALGTFFATARDLITQNMPASIKNDVQSLFNDMAEHAGGKPIQGKILEEGTDQPSTPSFGTERQTAAEKEVAI